MKYAITLVTVALLGVSGIALAQHQGGHQGPQGGPGMHGGGHGGPPAASANDTPATKAYRAANDKMHAGMDIEYSDNADVDFLRGMIPHHQGAIDMAKVVLEHGKDPRVRKLAEEVIRAQEGEIADMRKWLKEMGK